MNRHWQQREREQKQQRFQDANPATSVTGTIAHPHRSLPPGKQWLPHTGKRQIARARRQQAALEAKRLRKQYGSDIVSGRDPETGGLLLDIPGPTRIPPQQER